MNSIETLRIVFADSLCMDSSLIKTANKNHDVFLFMEVHEEFSYVPHHFKKVIFLLSAMRHFAKSLQENGYCVRYIKHDDEKNTHTFSSEIERAIKELNPKLVAFISPGEYRVRQLLKQTFSKFEIKIQEHQDPKFLISHKEFKAWAGDKKSLQMEFFYRYCRKKFNILMKNDKPIGGKWNFDSDNRKKPPKTYKPHAPLKFTPDELTLSLINELKTKLKNHLGDDINFHFAVTRAQALEVLSYFIEKNLPNFGEYQDAMLIDEQWMSHSHLSFYINVGLLTPTECINAALTAFEKGKAAINSVEGFIRQILGWREYVRGIYWTFMPSYQNQNFLNANNPLPDFFWHGKTKMKCLSQCISQTIDNAYAHHIQRLMIIGNFCLLTSLDPIEVQAWYLAVYADAFEWVEMPNVQGMILYADGGLMSSKPYAASGAYINKMSNYCEQCSFSVKEKTGDKACPFNYLYWHFMINHRQKLQKNHRLAITYKQIDNMPEAQQAAIMKSAEKFFDSIYKSQ